MGTENERSPLDPMGGPTPADIIADAKNVLGGNNPRRRAEEAVGGPRRTAPRTFEEHIKEATGQFPTVDGEELDPAAAQAAHARRAAARREAAGRSGEVGRGRGSRDGWGAGAGGGADAGAEGGAGAGDRAGASGAAASRRPGGRAARRAEGVDGRVPGADDSGRTRRADAPGVGVASGADADAGANAADASASRTGLGDARRRAGGDGAPGAGKRRSRAAAEAQAEARRRVRARRWLVVRIVLGVLAAVLLAVAVAFSCFRWLGGNDAEDIQGVWFVNGTDASITVTPNSIVLTDEVSYRYELDPEDKTIAFSFSKLTGNGHYRFSLDRQSVAIIDGDFTWGDTLAADFGWTAKALLASARGESLPPASGKNVTLLSRTSASARAAQDAARQSAAPDAAAQAASEDGGVLGAKVEDAGSADGAGSGTGAGADGASAAGGAGAEGATPDGGAGATTEGGGSDGTAGASGSAADDDAPVYDPDKPLEPGGNAVDAATTSS